MSCFPLSGSRDLPCPQAHPLDISPWPPPGDQRPQSGFSIFILKRPLLRVLFSRDLSGLTQALGLWDWNDDGDSVSTPSHLGVFWKEIWGEDDSSLGPAPRVPSTASQVLASSLSFLPCGIIAGVTASRVVTCLADGETGWLAHTQLCRLLMLGALAGPTL